MTWLLLALAWVLLALPLGVLLGRGIRCADTAAVPDSSLSDLERHLHDHALSPLA